MLAKNIIILLIIAVTGSGCRKDDSLRGSAERQTLNKNASVETNTLSMLIGKWDAKQERLGSDGIWHEVLNQNQWHWYFILNGNALQDDWISVKLDKDGNDSTVVYGTNIRIYNAEENIWHMAWIHQDTQTLQTFTATNNNNDVIMRGKNFLGREIRNTFFDISENGFEWQQEWTFDEGKSWTIVAKIHCTRLDGGRNG